MLHDINLYSYTQSKLSYYICDNCTVHDSRVIVFAQKENVLSSDVIIQTGHKITETVLLN